MLALLCVQMARPVSALQRLLEKLGMKDWQQKKISWRTNVIALIIVLLINRFGHFCLVLASSDQLNNSFTFSRRSTNSEMWNMLGL